MEGAYGAEPGVVGAVMVWPKGSGVNPQGRGTGTEIWELKAVRSRPRGSTGHRSSGLSGKYGPRANTGARVSRFTDA